MTALNLPRVNNARMLALAVSMGIGMLAGACTSGTSPTTTSTEPSPAAVSPTNTQPTGLTPEADHSNGEIAPDFTLPAATGGEVSLNDFQGQKPVVLVFYRAFW